MACFTGKVTILHPSPRRSLWGKLMDAGLPRRVGLLVEAARCCLVGFDNAPQEWAGCLGEMMAWPWRRNPNTRSLAAIWVYYSTGWRRLSSVWRGKVWENEKIFWWRLGRRRGRGGEGRQNKNSSISNYLIFCYSQYDFVLKRKNSSMSNYSISNCSISN